MTYLGLNFIDSPTLQGQEIQNGNRENELMNKVEVDVNNVK